MKTKHIKLFLNSSGKIPYLKEVLKVIPTDTILCKTLTGLGATYGEIKANRHSIIIEPNVPVIKGKCKDPKHKNDNLKGVYEGITAEMIIDYITNTIENRKQIKLLTTPESFSKIKSAFEYLEINVYQTCFLLFDECHKVVKDADYREGIHLPMDDFFMFKDKALVSATPLEFTDPRFNTFQYLIIEPQFNYEKKLHICHTNNTLQILKDKIKQGEKEAKNRFFIFVNSTDTIHSIMKQMAIFDESAVFCADTSMKKLKKQGIKDVYTDWEVSRMKKFNFLTSRFNAAFDIIIDEKPDVFMLTDLYLVEHTILDPNSDIIQIIGRFRNGVDYTAHITNTRGDYLYRGKEEVQDEIKVYEGCYKLVLREHNTVSNKGSKVAFRALLRTSPYNKFLDSNKHKNYFAIDNYINETMVMNLYQNRDTLFDSYNTKNQLKHFMAYRESYYFRAGDYERLQLTNLSQSITSKRRVIVDILEKVLPCETESDFLFLEQIADVDPLIIEAVNLLGIETVRTLRYITKNLREAVNEEKRIQPEVVKLIKEYFKVGGKYTLPEIKSTIKAIYEKCGIPSNNVTAQTIKLYFQATRTIIKGKEGLYIISELT